MELDWDDATRSSALSVDSLSAFGGVPERASASTDSSAAEHTPNEGVIVALLDVDSQSGCLDNILGQAVRLFPTCLIVHTANTSLPDTTFFAFGFRRLKVVVNNSAEQRQWYEYCLSDYKQPPDWLNARFWANPERFGLDEQTDQSPEWESDEEDDEEE